MSNPFDFAPGNPPLSATPSRPSRAKTHRLLLVIGGLVALMLSCIICGGAGAGVWWLMRDRQAPNGIAAAKPNTIKEPNQAGKSIDDLIAHMQRKGLNAGYKKDDSGIFPGDVAHASCEGPDYFFRIHEYRTVEFAENHMKGIHAIRKNMDVTAQDHRNGRFVIQIIAGESNVLPAFKSFK